jgi:hypothetical protein
LISLYFSSSFSFSQTTSAKGGWLGLTNAPFLSGTLSTPPKLTKAPKLEAELGLEPGLELGLELGLKLGLELGLELGLGLELDVELEEKFE